MAQNKQSRHPYSIVIIKEVSEMLIEFGTYNYYDKNIDEVLDIAPYIHKLRQMTKEQVADIFCDLAEYKHGTRIGFELMYELFTTFSITQRQWIYDKIKLEGFDSDEFNPDA